MTHNLRPVSDELFVNSFQALKHACDYLYGVDRMQLLVYVEYSLQIPPVYHAHSDEHRAITLLCRILIMYDVWMLNP